MKFIAEGIHSFSRVQDRTLPLTFWGLAAVLCAVSLLTATGCGKERKPYQLSNPETPTLHEITLSGPPRERGEDMSWSGASSPTMLEVTELLHKATDRPGIKGIFVHLGPFSGAYARAAELSTLLSGLRKAKKQVHCHIQSIDNVAYLVAASSCDQISMTPGGQINLVGAATQVLYAKDLLSRWGINAELEQVGKHKGAADTFTRSAMPDPVRQSLGKLITGLNDALVGAISKRRSISKKRAESLLSQGPFSAKAAKRAGLVDRIAFADEARSRAKRATKSEKVTQLRWSFEQEDGGIGALIAALAGEEPQRPDQAHVAVATLAGTINDADGPKHLSAAAGPFIRTMTALRNDDHVDAVVLRIDSPGGSALASDRMWHAVHMLSKRKPVIASIGNMAASGGYYIASAATEIIAEPTSLIGSIGVVGGKIQFEKAIAMLGLEVETLKAAEHGTWSSPLQAFSQDERKQLRRELWQVYDRFLRRVGTGRRLSRAQVLKAADGKIMTGRDALAYKLIDKTGSLKDALHIARRKTKLSAESPMWEWPPSPSIVDALGMTGVKSLVLGDSMGDSALSDQSSDKALERTLNELGAPRAVTRYLLALRGAAANGTHIAALPPYALTVE